MRKPSLTENGVARDRFHGPVGAAAERARAADFPNLRCRGARENASVIPIASSKRRTAPALPRLRAALPEPVIELSEICFPHVVIARVDRAVHVAIGVEWRCQTKCIPPHDVVGGVDDAVAIVVAVRRIRGRS